MYRLLFYILVGALLLGEALNKVQKLSSNEAEYIALSDATKKGFFLIKLLNEIWDETTEKGLILTNNKGLIKLVKNPVFHKWTEHIDIRHFIRES